MQKEKYGMWDWEISRKKERSNGEKLREEWGGELWGLWELWGIKRVYEGEIKRCRRYRKWRRREEGRRETHQTLTWRVARRLKLTPAKGYEVVFLLKTNEASPTPSNLFVPYIIIHVNGSVWLRALPPISFLFSNIFHWNCCTCELGTNESETSVCCLGRRWVRVRFLIICQNDHFCWKFLKMIPLKLTAVCLSVCECGVTRRAHMGPSFPFPCHPHGTCHFWIGLIATLAESGFIENIHCFS